VGHCFEDPLQPLTNDSQQDVGILQDCERIITEAKDGLGGLDIIISNAVSCLGLSPGLACTFKVQFPEAHRRFKIFDICFGPLGCCK